MDDGQIWWQWIVSSDLAAQTARKRRTQGGVRLGNGIKPDPNAGGKTHPLLILHFVFHSRLFSHLLLRLPHL